MSPSMASPGQKSLPINVSVRKRTEAPRWPSKPAKKYRSMTDIMARSKYAVIGGEDYSDVHCEECGNGDRENELLLCDKCDRGFHMSCLRPIVVRVPIGSWLCSKCSGQGRVKSRFLFFFGVMYVTIWSLLYRSSIRFICLVF